MMRDIGLQFYFLMLSLALVSWQYWPQNPLGSVSSSFIFWKCLWRLWISSFYLWQNLSMKPRWAGLFFVAGLLIANLASCHMSIQTLDSWVSFANLSILRMLSVSPKVSNLWAQSITLSFVSSVPSLLFILDFGTFYLLYFLLVSPAAGFSICWYFQLTSSWFYWSFLFLFHWLLL